MVNRWSQILGWTCVVLWSGLFVAALWPFTFYPRNSVRWIQPGGLRFKAYGQAYSTSPWALNDVDGKDLSPFCIELWMRGGQTNYLQQSPIFSIDGSAADRALDIAQSGPALVVRGYFRNSHGAEHPYQLWFYNAYRDLQPVFLTITSSEKGTILYVNGVQQQWDAPLYPVYPGKYSGRLVLGHTPGGNSAWTGDIFGLAAYSRALSAEEVAQHYRGWLQHTHDQFRDARALYTFDEHSGAVVHNRAGSAPDLVIPARFLPLHPVVLGLPHPFRLARKTTVINILGLCPFGFFLCAYLVDVKQYSPRNALILTIILGTLTSLVIELLQVFLPSRDSGLLDVITNCVGTAGGAFFQITYASWREGVLRVISSARPSALKSGLP